MAKALRLVTGKLIVGLKVGMALIMFMCLILGRVFMMVVGFLFMFMGFPLHCTHAIFDVRRNKFALSLLGQVKELSPVFQSVNRFLQGGPLLGRFRRMFETHDVRCRANELYEQRVLIKYYVKVAHTVYVAAVFAVRLFGHRRRS
jgi:type IV secretory pathway VirB3-like protein